MDPTKTQPHANLMVFQILQCLHGIYTWFPQATGERTLKFLDSFFVELNHDFKPALPSNLLHHQVQQMSNSFARQLANLTIIHYRKRISDCVQQLCYIKPTRNHLYNAVGRAITKGKEKWGRKLHDSVITELNGVCQNLAYHNQRDNKYKEAHKRMYGLSCHVTQYKDYLTPFPADPKFPNTLIATSLANYQNVRGVASVINTTRPLDDSHRPHPYYKSDVMKKSNTRTATRTELPSLIPKSILTVKPPTKVPTKVPSPNIIINSTPDLNLDNIVLISSPITPMNVTNDSIKLVLDGLLADTRPRLQSPQVNTTTTNSSQTNTVASQTVFTPIQRTLVNEFTPSLTPVEATTDWNVQKSRTSTHQTTAFPLLEDAEPILTRNTFSPLLSLDPNDSGSSTESESLLTPTVEEYPLPQKASWGIKKKGYRPSQNRSSPN